MMAVRTATTRKLKETAFNAVLQASGLPQIEVSVSQFMHLCSSKLDAPLLNTDVFMLYVFNCLFYLPHKPILPGQLSPNVSESGFKQTSFSSHVLQIGTSYTLYGKYLVDFIAPKILVKSQLFLHFVLTSRNLISLHFWRHAMLNIGRFRANIHL